MTTVCRVEDVLGSGPYKASGVYEVDDFARELGWAHNDGDERIGVANDGFPLYALYMEGVNAGWVCGFDSLTSCAWWFDGWLAELDAHGYHVSEYAADEVLTGYSGEQVLFKRGTLLRTIPCSTLDHANMTQTGA